VTREVATADVGAAIVGPCSRHRHRDTARQETGHSKNDGNSRHSFLRACRGATRVLPKVHNGRCRTPQPPSCEAGSLRFYTPMQTGKPAEYKVER
jgi:hypothetical protein